MSWHIFCIRIIIRTSTILLQSICQTGKNEKKLDYEFVLGI